MQKPVHGAFEAIVDPAKMSNYFIAASTGRMEEGKAITWKFPEFDMEFPIRVGKIVMDKHISYYWNDFNDDTETLVEITLTPKKNISTFVHVNEKSRNNNEAGIKWLKET